MVVAVRLLRDTIPVRIDGKILEGEHVVYAVKHRKTQHANDLLLACWHIDRWNPFKGRSVYVLRDEQDWFLFKIANGITDSMPVVIV
jgi:hypothetical protein